MKSLKRKRILIFGGTGSLGKKLIQRFKDDNKVAVYSRDEAKHWTLRNELGEKGKNVSFYVGDIRDGFRVKEVIENFGPDIVIVAAALKQVDTCELSPLESIKTNLLGTQNVIEAVQSQAVRSILSLKVLFVSTDKACSPVNVYGMCKSVSERLITSQAASLNPTITFLSTRYGNVLESRGSIIPLFRYQAENADALTVTDSEMTRFVMTLDDSVDLIVNTLNCGNSGETWIPILPAMKIGDLAEIFAEKHGKKVKIIGLRPGEKKHEDLVNESESVRTDTRSIDNVKHHVIGPAFNAGDSSQRFTYSSNDDVMSKQDLKKLLTDRGIIDCSLDDFEGKNIEEIRV